ncbi:tyrosine-type recombinase/integrase [Pelagibius sp.]|uniref:tyrosine-type recombinase/integrase n=1 Tax=Pelagibius sp. TaxID=1931238 RepID=UPI003BB06DA7
MPAQEALKPTKLTEALVRSLEPTDKPYTVRDTAVKGLMLAVNKRSKSYKVQRDLWVGDHGRRRLVKTVRRTLGTADRLTVKDARREAMKVIAAIQDGVDPNDSGNKPRAESWTLQHMYEEYAADMRARDCSEENIQNVLARKERHLKDWSSYLIADIKRSMCRERHKKITTQNGKVSANQTFREFRAAYNIALRVADDPDSLPDNPVKAVTFNKERGSERVIMPDDLPHWWERVTALRNPLRSTMHELGIFSGLRPRYLVSIEREWVHLEERAILIPKMKAGRSFALPLSTHMVSIAKRALELSDMMYPRAKWLYPSRSSKTGALIATQVWKERSLPSETGHILRHTHRTVAQRIKVDPINRRLLLDQTVQGIDGVYVHEKALFDKLLSDQELISAELLRLMGRTNRRTGD